MNAQSDSGDPEHEPTEPAEEVDDDGPQYRSPVAPTRVIKSDTELDDMTRAELRVWIARTVACHTTPRTPLDISSLNSVYAYLTGEFCVSPRDVGTSRSPGTARVREKVAIEVSNRAGEDDFAFGTMDGYLPDPDEDTSGWEAQPLRKENLLAIASCLKWSDDKRSWL